MLGMAESHKTEASSKLTTTTERGSEAQQYLPPQCCAVLFTLSVHGEKSFGGLSAGMESWTLLSQILGFNYPG